MTEIQWNWAKFRCSCIGDERLPLPTKNQIFCSRLYSGSLLMVESNALAESSKCFCFQPGIQISQAFSAIVINAHTVHIYKQPTWLDKRQQPMNTKKTFQSLIQTHTVHNKGNSQWPQRRHFTHWFILTLCMTLLFVPIQLQQGYALHCLYWTACLGQNQWSLLFSLLFMHFN